MFADTLTITINTVAKVLTRINQDKYSSEYFLRGATEEFSMAIRNSSYTRKPDGKLVDRHAVELIHTVYAVSPATQNTVRKVYTVLENERSDTIVDPAKFAVGFAGFLTEPNFTKLINRES